MTRRVVFGVGPVRELIAARPAAVAALWVSPARDRRAERGDPVAELAARARAAGIPVESRRGPELDEAAGPGGNHQGVVALARDYVYASLESIVEAVAARPPGLVVVLDGVSDPHNLGAVARSAYLFGAHGLVIGKDRSASVNPAATKASAGAVEHLAIAQVTNLVRALDELKEAGLWIAAVADAPDARPIWQLDATAPLALVLGAEGSGIRPLVARQADHRVLIPMHGGAVGSFNVSVAAGVALYEIARQRA